MYNLQLAFACMHSFLNTIYKYLIIKDYSLINCFHKTRKNRGSYVTPVCVCVCVCLRVQEWYTENCVIETHVFI